MENTTDLKDFITKDINRKIVFDMAVNAISETNVNPRMKLDDANLIMLSGIEGEFEPIHIGSINGEYIVVDGYHRLSVTKSQGKLTIPAFITEYDSMEDLKLDAFKFNSSHGIRLSEKDQISFFYPMYQEMIVKNPSLKVAEFGRRLNISNPRNARRFINTGLIIDILGVKNIEQYKFSLYEEAYSLIDKRGCKINSVTDEVKDEVKELFRNYGHMPRGEFRIAVKCVIEGTTYEDAKKAETATTVKTDVSSDKPETLEDILSSFDEGTKEVVEQKTEEKTEVENVAVDETVKSAESLVKEVVEQVAEKENKIKEELVVKEVPTGEFVKGKLGEILGLITLLEEKADSSELEGKHELEELISELERRVEAVCGKLLTKIQPSSLF